MLSLITRLEKALRNFSCLHEGDTISISYIGQVFDVLVLEAKPSTAISIFETDLEVDFAPPPGYVEPRRILAEKSLVNADTIVIILRVCSLSPFLNFLA